MILAVAAAATMSRRSCVFCCESENTLFGLPKEDTTRNQWLSCIYNTVPEQFNPNIRVCSTFYGGLFPDPGREDYSANCSDSQSVSTFTYVKDLPLMIQTQVLSSVEQRFSIPVIAQIRE